MSYFEKYVTCVASMAFSLRDHPVHTVHYLERWRTCMCSLFRATNTEPEQTRVISLSTSSTVPAGTVSK